MNENWNNPRHYHRGEEECGPVDDPAPQPEEPSGKCEPLPHSHAPHLPEPQPCPEPPCCCPHPPVPPGPNCLDDLIRQQAKESAEAEEAAKTEKFLTDIRDKAIEALKTYTGNTYHQLVKDWRALDVDIAELIRRLVCNIPCWKCVIECHVCPLLHAIHYREQKLHGDWKEYDNVHSLYDLQYWYANDVRRKQGIATRIEDVMHAWETPAATIAQVIAANRDAVDKPPNQNSPEYGKFLYDVFLRIVPLHLAIAPPAATGIVTTISAEYTQFCECGVRQPDNCCGPDVGVPSLRQQLVRPQPYLVRPDQLLSIICCIAKERYLPAANELARAQAHRAKIDQDVAQYEAEITSKLKTLPDDAKAALPWPIDCESYEMPERPHRQGRDAAPAR